MIVPRPLAAVIVSAVALAAGAVLTTVAIGSGTPDQAANDGSSATATLSPSGGLWGDMAGGAAARPFVRSLSVVNGGVAAPVIVNGTTTARATLDGNVTAVVAPLNLCRAGESPSPGRCSPVPDRVAVALGYADNGVVGTDFASPEVPLRQRVDADTVFDIVIGLNTLGTTLRWTWLNGDLEYWSATNLGRADAEIHLRVRPVATPTIDWGAVPGNGCAATPIGDCDLAQAQGESLSASLVLSLDDTLDPSLTGAVFATQGAVAGFLVPKGTTSAPVLDLQIASAHLTAAGAPQTGRLAALIPAQALLNLYGVLPADAARLLTTRRTGAAGTQGPPGFTRWTAAVEGTDGLLVEISDITFSAPTYTIARRARAPRTSARRRGATTTFTAAAVPACRASACIATIFGVAGRLAGRATIVGSGRTGPAGALKLRVPARRLAADSRYTLVLRKRGALVTTAVGAPPRTS